MNKRGKNYSSRREKRRNIITYGVEDEVSTAVECSLLRSSGRILETKFRWRRKNGSEWNNSGLNRSRVLFLQQLSGVLFNLMALNLLDLIWTELIKPELNWTYWNLLNLIGPDSTYWTWLNLIGTYWTLLELIDLIETY